MSANCEIYTRFVEEKEADHPWGSRCKICNSATDYLCWVGGFNGYHTYTCRGCGLQVDQNGKALEQN